MCAWVRKVKEEVEEEVRKTAAAKVRQTKCHRDPGPDHRNSGTSDLYFTCSLSSQPYRKFCHHNIIIQ